jgi:hypothetical protein
LLSLRGEWPCNRCTERTEKFAPSNVPPLVMTNTISSLRGGGIDLGHGLLSDRLMSQMLDSFTAANGGRVVSLLDHLVGKREQAIWHREPQSLGGLEAEHQVELGRLHHRQVGRLLALENPADINAGPAIRVR